MRIRLSRLALFLFPFSGALALFAACSSSDNVNPPAPTPDATADTAAPPDSGVGVDGSLPDVRDGASNDAGADADAEAAAPPLCQKYPNVLTDGGVDSVQKLYDLIAYRALNAAAARCEIGAHFAATTDSPYQIDCLGKQLVSPELAHCFIAGEPIVYAIQRDGDGTLCSPEGGAPNVVIGGFRNPSTSSYTANDFDLLIQLIRDAAVSSGMSAADADRLKALLVAQKKSVVVVDAGPGDAGFSQSTCP